MSSEGKMAYPSGTAWRSPRVQHGVPEGYDFEGVVDELAVMCRRIALAPSAS